MFSVGAVATNVLMYVAQVNCPFALPSVNVVSPMLVVTIELGKKHSHTMVTVYLWPTAKHVNVWYIEVVSPIE